MKTLFSLDRSQTFHIGGSYLEEEKKTLFQPFFLQKKIKLTDQSVFNKYFFIKINLPIGTFFLLFKATFFIDY